MGFGLPSLNWWVTQAVDGLSFAYLVFGGHDIRAIAYLVSASELLAGIQSILGDAEVGQKLSINAKKIVETNQGSTQIQLSYILDKLGEKNWSLLLQ